MEEENKVKCMSMNNEFFFCSLQSSQSKNKKRIVLAIPIDVQNWREINENLREYRTLQKQK